MIDYLQQGHMALIKPNLGDKWYYIPHHETFKLKGSSTLIRVVYDASAKTENNIFLNELLFVDPKLQNDIFVILINFCIFPIALSADIKQTYRQIIVDKSHRKLQRILWRFSSNDPFEIYELNCVVFGTSSLPYLALRTVYEVVKGEGRNYPAIRNRLPGDMHVDDFITSVSSPNEVLLLYQHSKQLFQLTK